ncbi:MAG: hypothetical protein OEY06_03975 [Gammaproteobacteria bacterium]|nr:hypothetical protein [Gammaproteobacteria bacterium]
MVTYTTLKKMLILFICAVSLISCGALRTFHEYARAGDTIAVPVGTKANFSKDNITVTITPPVGNIIVLNATDPKVRAIINFYPDPISSMIVSREIGTNLTPAATTYADTMLITAGRDKDYFQTVVFIDLPATLPVGLTQVEISNGLGELHQATLDVIDGIGTANSFNSDFSSGLLLSADMLDSLARTSHTTVNIDSAVIPHAIEISFTHDPDASIGGVGKAFVVNPLGYRKTLHWSDDGTNMTIIMNESKAGLIDHMNDYKFYITGTVTGLVFGTVKGYDINGALISGVTATTATQ